MSLRKLKNKAKRAINKATTKAKALPKKVERAGKKAAGKVTDNAETVARVAAPGTMIAVDVVKGKKPREAVKKTVKAPVELARDGYGAVAGLEAKGVNVAGRLAEAIGGTKGRRFGEDLLRLAKPLDARSAQGLLSGVERFIDTGELSHLNPLVFLGASELRRAREAYWDRAAPIPAAVVDKMPSLIKPHARAARFIIIKSVSRLSLPVFAIQHFDEADAVTTIDLIFFRRVPGSRTNGDLHYWLHELYHVRQFAVKGLEGFVERYVGEQIRNKGVNELEARADRFACKYFPVPNPRYIGECPGDRR